MHSSGFDRDGPANVVLFVALAAPLVVDGAVARFQDRCEAGNASPVVCHVAELGGLFAEPALATSAGADAP